jgi:Rps23 Pro-64 3,4-dihydroxylase Tpa1-like proline 4-hydroxylase
MDVVGHFFTEIARTCSDMVGDWTDLVTRSYLYPRGSKLSWHNDAANYAGAFSFYAHPKWGSTWGGELMVAEVPPMSEMKKKPLVGPHIEHDWEDEYINEQGVGQWITPKPNRCVIMAPGVYHSINRVDVDAGDHARAAIVGFLLKSSTVSPPAPPKEHIDLEIKTIGSL